MDRHVDLRVFQRHAPVRRMNDLKETSVPVARDGLIEDIFIVNNVLMCFYHTKNRKEESDETGSKFHGDF